MDHENQGTRMFSNSQQRMGTIHRFRACGESWMRLDQDLNSARRLALNTNAKVIGLLLLLCLGVGGSPVLAQTPAATPEESNGIVDLRKQSAELLRRARVSMKRGNLDLAERFVSEAEKLDAPQNGILSRFADSPEKVRKDLAKLRTQQPARPQSADPNKGTVIALPTAAPTATGTAAINGGLAFDAQQAVKARSMMAQARAALDRGDLGLAETLSKQAAGLQIPDSGYAGGDTPWELEMKIQKQRRLTGTVAPVAATSAPQGSQVQRGFL